MSDTSTIVDVLRWRAVHESSHPAYTFLTDGETEEVSLTYHQLDQKARAIGAGLQTMGEPGVRALLLYPPGLEFIAAFFACLYAGIIPVPVSPPASPSRSTRGLVRLSGIANNAQPQLLLTSSRVLPLIDAFYALELNWPVMSLLTTENISTEMSGQFQTISLNCDSLAFLQYTSGSTATPKGVMVTHKNILSNQQMIRQAFGHNEHSTFVGWLPLFHDMGLIGNILQPLFLGSHCILISPLHFLQKPARWLQSISRYKAHTSGAPNFAYDLCVAKVKPEQKATLDLSSWKVAFNGSEPINDETINRFIAAFEPCGFRRETFYPCYGLAEATLFVSGGLKGEVPISYTVDAIRLERDGWAVPSTERKGVRTLVGCGRSWSDQKIIIVDPQSLTELPPCRVGEIWVSGASVAQGYWTQPSENQHTFNAYLAGTGVGPFLRTGDLGFLLEGELFITGRMKNVIIIRGRNHYPQDIERTVQSSHPCLAQGCTAAFSIDVNGEESVIILAEIARPSRQADMNQIVAAIRRTVADEHELEIFATMLLRPGSISKSSSGKIQYFACRASFLAGSLNARSWYYDSPQSYASFSAV